MTSAMSALASGKPRETALPTPRNPLAARSCVYTIVTPDMAASLLFYRHVMGYDLIEAGQLAEGLPAIDGAALASRRYALLRHDEDVVSERGVIRLIEAPFGALANRPRPGSAIMDPGLAVIECHPQDWTTAYRTLIRHGVEVVSPPQHYYGGAGDNPKTWNMSWSCLGPAGEQIFVSSHPDRPKRYSGLFGPLGASTLMCRDRWPLWDFYEALLGIKAWADIYLGEETLNFMNVNTMVNAPRGTYIQFGMMGDDLTMEWWEFRQWRPTATPPWPTSLDRTGLAMTTIIVDELDTVRARAARAGLAIAEGRALPVPGTSGQPALHARGAVGELVEIIGRA